MRVVVLFLLASIGAVAWSQDLVPRGDLFGPFEMVRVVDGERFVIDLPDYDETVRLVGLDVRGQSDAAVILGRVLSGRGVWLEVVEPARDIAGNIQGYAYVLDPQGRWSYNGQRFSQVNRLLGGQGYAGLATTSQDVFRSTNRVSVSMPPSVATINVNRIGERAPTPLSFDEARLRRVGAPQRQGRLNLRLLGDTITGTTTSGTTMTGTTTTGITSGTTTTGTTPTHRITTTVTTTTTTDGAGTTRVITGTASSCQDFASWDDAQAFGVQLPLNQRAAFDEDGDGVFCEVLLLERRCDSFASWEDAQAFLETLAPNSASARQLDGDGDGVACERLLVGSTTTPPAANVSVNVTTTPPTSATTPNSVITDLSVSPRAPAVSARQASNCIDLNQASLSELSHLAGVTLFRADQIVRNRPYALVSDLTRLPGFSAQMIASIDAQGLACVR